MGAGVSTLPDNAVILAELQRLQREDPARATELLAAATQKPAPAVPRSKTKAYLLEQVDPVLSPMVKQLAAEKPADVEGWLRDRGASVERVGDNVIARAGSGPGIVL